MGQSPKRQPPTLDRYDFLILGSAIGAGIFIRLPLFYNLDHLFNADVAFNALTMKHILEGKEFYLYYPGQDYQGIVEGLVGLFFFCLLGYSNLAYQLAAFTFFNLFVIVSYALAKQMGDRLAAIFATLFVLLTGKPLLYWSLMPVGGHMMTVFFSSLLFLLVYHHASSGEEQKRTTLCLIAFFSAFAYYAYKLIIVILLPIGFYFVHRVLRYAVRESSLNFKNMRTLTFPLIFFVVGLSPVLLARIFQPPNPISLSFGFASPEKIRSNWELFHSTCLPLLLGFDARGTLLWYWPLFVIVGAIVYAVYQVLLQDREAFWMKKPLSMNSLLLLSLLSTCLSFILNPNPMDATSNRYLVPIYAALPVLLGLFIRKLWGYKPVVGQIIVTLFTATFIVHYSGLHISNYQHWGALRGREIRVVPHPFREIAQFLTIHGIRGGFADYWVSYPVTFFSQEQTIIVPDNPGQDRYPRYREYVSTLPPPLAYIFETSDEKGLIFESYLKAESIQYVKHYFKNYVVYLKGKGAPALSYGDGIFVRRVGLAEVYVLPDGGWAPSASAPAAVIIPDNTLYLFVQDIDGRIYLNTRSNDIWSGWQLLALEQTLLHPSAVVDLSGTVHIFVRGTNNRIYETTLIGSTRAREWQEVSGGGFTPSAPEAVLDPVSGIISLFVRGFDNRIYMNTHTGGSWGGWKEVPGSLTSSEVKAVYDRTGVLWLFVRSVNNRIYAAFRSGTSRSPWHEIGGTTYSGLGAVVSGENLILFARGTDNRIYMNTRSNGQWSGWSKVPGDRLTQDAPAAVVDSQGKVLLFVRGKWP